MAVVAARVSVSTSAVELSGTDDTSAGQRVIATNRGTASVYLGGSAVAADTGFELGVGDTMSADLVRTDRLYAIAASGTHTVHVLRAGVA